jgi:hypothetical protein
LDKTKHIGLASGILKNAFCLAQIKWYVLIPCHGFLKADEFMGILNQLWHEPLPGHLPQGTF